MAEIYQTRFMEDYILPDVLNYNLRLVLCGTAASRKSAQVRAYYAGPGNRFWETLYQVGLTPCRLQPSEFRVVTEYGIGLTDLAKFNAGTDTQLSKQDFDVAALQQKIRHYTPSVLAFTSKRAATEFYKIKAGQRLDYGLQPEDYNATAIFVLPSPSGAARGFWNVDYWLALANYVNNLGK